MITMDEARAHCEAGIGIWEWAGNAGDQTPDLVIACAGNVPTIESIAAAQILRERIPSLRIRFVNVVDLMTLSAEDKHPHPLSDEAFLQVFTADKPVLLAFHGYPSFSHRLTSERPNHANFHVRGYMEEGAATTPFDMAVLNRLDRFSLARSALHITDANRTGAAETSKWLDTRLDQRRAYVKENGIDLPEIRYWNLSTSTGLLSVQ